jgi:large subunit ribosomal protein L15
MLEREGVIQNAEARLKVLGEGDLRGPVTIRAHGFSATARQKIEAAGGTAELIPAPKRLKRYRKKIRKETAEA